MPEAVKDKDESRGAASPLRRLARVLARARRGGDDADLVHQLRTACRRGEAALDVFGANLDQNAARRAGRLLRRVRRAAGPVRECDVHLRMLGEFIERAPGALRGAAEEACRLLRDEREAALPRLREATARYPGRRVRRIIRELGAPPGQAAAAARVDDLSRRLGERPEPTKPEEFHDLRVGIKRVRYTLELAGSALRARAADAVGPLVDLQELLGRARDAHTLAARLEGYAGATPVPAMERLARRFGVLRVERLREAHESVPGLLAGALAALGAALRPPVVPRQRAGPARLGAIDVGSNSVRLMVVEAHGASAYRVLDDEREVTRLGAGLGRRGALDEGAIAATADAVDRFRRIAEGYRVDALRVVGTAACRDARNAAALVDRVRARSGLELEIISEEEEGRLAFQSAAHSFDLRDHRAAVIDIGGGSTEVVFSAGGAIERIASLRLGAVRTTERHGGARRARGVEYDAMRRRVKKTIRRVLGKPGASPQTVIGIGGTFTTLAAILQHREHGARGPSLWDRSVPGREVTRSQLRHVLDWFRALEDEELRCIPGLPPERADIIVAGLTIVERLLKHLGANVVHVHDRGIRDGVVLGLAAGLFDSGVADRPDPMASVRQFAEACRYEAAHSEHVARLAVSIHDQLVGALGENSGWASSAGRRLLEAGGVLHDVGYLVNYSKHHRHGYHLIAHSGLSGHSPRELGVIANLAFYHRQAEPSAGHPNFAALSRKDRDLVRRLAAILRVADGLDRTHTQRVEQVTLNLTRGGARFDVRASGDASTDLWGAERKAGLFREVFGLIPSFKPAPGRA